MATPDFFDVYRRKSSTPPDYSSNEYCILWPLGQTCTSHSSSSRRNFVRVSANSLRFSSSSRGQPLETGRQSSSSTISCQFEGNSSSPPLLEGLAVVPEAPPAHNKPVLVPELGVSGDVGVVVVIVVIVVFVVFVVDILAIATRHGNLEDVADVVVLGVDLVFGDWFPCSPGSIRRGTICGTIHLGNNIACRSKAGTVEGVPITDKALASAISGGETEENQDIRGASLCSSDDQNSTATASAIAHESAFRQTGTGRFSQDQGQSGDEHSTHTLTPPPVRDGRGRRAGTHDAEANQPFKQGEAEQGLEKMAKGKGPLLTAVLTAVLKV
ncbi:hypothetical protein B0H10DRAFT_1944575 [Mycena sp. CBHHK59/15]|nr:hypothetical protein B0H10DRAFT_1944575 [Mycena sp. CBHHK59/15]